MVPRMHPLLLPRAVRPGDVVAVAGLSGPVRLTDRPLLKRGVGVLTEMGFQVRVTPPVAQRRRRWWAAGTPQELAAELNALLRDPQVRAIVAHTGGSAVASYLDLIDVGAVRDDPKPILGYSDISLLHLALHARTGLAGFHADLGTHGFGGDWFRLGDAARRAELSQIYLRVLGGDAPVVLPPHAGRKGGGWQCWRPGTARGPLVGGLLNRLVRLQSTPYALLPERFDGAVLFWEEVRRPLEWVWSDLHLLRIAGVLDRIAAMVVGVPHQVTTEYRDPPPLREVVLDVLGDRDLPVLGHVDFGHTTPNLPLPIGVAAEVDASARTLTLLEPAVQT